ncbi:MAG: AAA family ATPase [Candidatus Omnitrophica bacterium]|nr:AAA family ATPase [Candidatus Omnitrophota bacterium]
MYFKKLELVGFKSFADKTTLHFEPGITAVVGPNGCGKSNIFDSIRWVLGEQSIKELRGSQSQDVIFNGSDSKEQLSMAEVTLVFDNSSRFFSLEHNEVAITRRIFRSGESEYLLNKQLVRLKDILDLLLGTGIGAESYSLVQQGKIDLVLSSRPEDRRLVFDEASGITKYKSQKREALRKLEETEQNLLRLNDIIVEVKRQIGSLERQANKARRYKEVFEELKNKEINLALYQKKQLLQEIDEVKNALVELESQEAGFLEEIKQEEAKISLRQNELKELQDAVVEIKNQIIGFENSLMRNDERVKFDAERIRELGSNKEYLLGQIEQVTGRLSLDEEKLQILRQEYSLLETNIENKTVFLKENEEELNKLTLAVKEALEKISAAKMGILDLASKIANFRNEITDFLSKQQIHLSRKKRLGIEKAKVNEEKVAVELELNGINHELAGLESFFSELNQRLIQLKNDREQETVSLSSIDFDIQGIEKSLANLNSQKEFFEKLRNEYEGINESMNAVIYLDKLPQEKLSGLVVKIKDIQDAAHLDPAWADTYKLKVCGEAKPMELSTEHIQEKIFQLEQKIDSLRVIKNVKQDHLNLLHKDIQDSEQSLRAQEMVLIDKRAQEKNILEQYHKIKEEEEIVLLELSEVDTELSSVGQNLLQLQTGLSEIEKQEKDNQDLILIEQGNIASSSQRKEDLLVLIAQAKAEKEGLIKRLSTDSATLSMMENTCKQQRDSLLHLENQAIDAQAKRELLESEIKELEEKSGNTKLDIQAQREILKEKESQYQLVHAASGSVIEKIVECKKRLDGLKTRLYELQMRNKDIDFKYLTLKDRLLQGYKIDLEVVLDQPQEVEEPVLREDIQRLKEKLDSYGTVNLVAIEEYDELKKRYDFLTQQQTDLNTAKESLHNAILKINRTTKQMFLETFEKVRVEFRNYFRLLFNGGDAQLFLTDEQDPLESGIEIICRPPGKKLQNVLLLSGGEKSLSAIALIFAIFKIKPAPFCVLDEIDAALDEANVDRYSRMLHEFVKDSQFIVITHNKKTIANADIMYGITMQESGVSRIVSVKFAKDIPSPEEKADLPVVPEPV